MRLLRSATPSSPRGLRRQASGDWLSRGREGCSSQPLNYPLLPARPPVRPPTHRRTPPHPTPSTHHPAVNADAWVGPSLCPTARPCPSVPAGLVCCLSLMRLLCWRPSLLTLARACCCSQCTCLHPLPPGFKSRSRAGAAEGGGWLWQGQGAVGWGDAGRLCRDRDRMGWGDCGWLWQGQGRVGVGGWGGRWMALVGRGWGGDT